MSDNNTTTAPQAVVVFERTYRAPVETLWMLWASKDGFESWWGPEGFRVEVQVLEPREGGALQYDMIADAPDAVAAMKEMGQPISQGVRGRYAEFHPYSHLRLVHVIDFVPGRAPYESLIDVDFRPQGDDARMVVTVHPHIDPFWTKMSVEGFTTQLSKLDRRFGWEAP
jgi:uncharacterized protein YndB with AHSA1/START domain